MRASAGSTRRVKVDKYTVRIISKEAQAIDPGAALGRAGHIAVRISTPSSRTRRASAAAAIGTGPYKVVSFDPNKIVLEKSPYYDWGGYEPTGSIRRIEIETIPDAQTRLAKVMVGELDLVFHIEYDQAKEAVARNPDYKILTAPTVSFSYILFDTADRSGIKVFKDRRVREAMLRAIDLQAMRKALPAA